MGEKEKRQTPEKGVFAVFADVVGTDGSRFILCESELR